MPILSLLTTKEAASRTRVHVATLRAWIRAGEGPPVTRLNGKRLIREDALVAWIEARTVPTHQAVAA